MPHERPGAGPISAIKNTVRSEKRGTHERCFALDSHRRALPGRTVTNEDLSRMVDTSDEWIPPRTGIRAGTGAARTNPLPPLPLLLQSRRSAAAALPGRHRLLHLCHPFGTGCDPQRCLPDSGSTEPAGKLPGAGRERGLLRLFVWHRRGTRAAGNDGRRYALVVGCEALSRLIDPTDRSTCVLFGDGAGAAVFELTAASVPFAVTLGARGDAAIHAGGPSREGSAPITMDGKAVFRFASGCSAQMSARCAGRNRQNTG